MKKEAYISVDVETDGPIPGPNSMLSLGAAAFDSDGAMVETFSVNLETLPDARPDPDTAKWWKTQPKEVQDAARKNPQIPALAMVQFSDWVNSQEGLPVFVGYPAGFDFLFVYWYLIRFVGKSPFSFSALDIKTFAMAQLKIGYRQTTKRRMPKRWFKDLPPHTHKAVDDAIEQGHLFMNILRENRGPS